jgi:hypothetical protein
MGVCKVCSVFMDDSKPLRSSWDNNPCNIFACIKINDEKLVSLSRRNLETNSADTSDLGESDIFAKGEDKLEDEEELKED